MRKMLFSIITGALLLGGAACKKDNSDTTDDKANAVQKAQEDVNDQREDIKDEAKDLKDEAQDLKDEAKDVREEAGELRTAQGNLAQARTEYANAVMQRMSKLDARIAELEARGTTEAKAKAADFKVRRDALNAKLETMKSQADTGWAAFTKEIDGSFDGIEHDVNDALD
jgi:chromosome segregation ATPase